MPATMIDNTPQMDYRSTTIPTAMPLQPLSYPRASYYRPNSTLNDCVPTVTITPTTVRSMGAPSYNPAKRSLEFETPFEAHLQDIYDGVVDEDAGLKFFESHGFYDVSEANTVEMFRQNFGMTEFWDGDENDEELYATCVETVDLAGLQILNLGSMLNTKPVARRRTTSGRFQIIDDDGNAVDSEVDIEAEKALRMKLQHMEVDEYDAAELEKEQVVLAKAINVIRTEKTRFRRYFYEAFNEEMQRSTTPRAVVPPPSPVSNIQLPAHSGYLYVLKDNIPSLFRSWHKRWIHIDFNEGLLKMYKRSYWMKERGVVDLRTVSNVTKMNQDIRLDCYNGKTVLLRAKNGGDETALWLNLLQFGRRQVGSSRPSVPDNVASTTVTTLATTNTAMLKSAAMGIPASVPPSAGFMVSTKLKSNERNVLDVMSKILAARNANSTSTPTNPSPNSSTAA